MILSKEQIEQFFDQGFLVIPDLFPKSLIEEISNSLNEIADICAGHSETFYQQGTQFVMSGSRIDRVVWCAGVRPEVLKLSHSLKLLNPVSQLLGTEELTQLICQAHYKFPGDGLQFPWHQDSEHRKYGSQYWKDVNKRGSYIQTLTAIDPVTLENGPVSFIPKSGSDGHLYLEKDNDQRRRYDDYEAVTPELSPGSVVLFGPYTIHGSRPNLSSKLRRVFINGFCYPGANSFEYPGSGQGLKVKIS